MGKKSFVRGAFILGVAGVVGKFIGAFFRIPLANIIQPEGIGLYQMAYPVYIALLTISTAGLPTAIAKMVAENLALGHNREAHRIFQISFKMLAILGIIATIILAAVTPLFAKFIQNDKVILPLLSIAPSLFFVSVMSAYRGYFQGMQMMGPTAVTQITEQIGKLVIGLSLAYALVGKGVEYGAAGAIIGVTLSEVIALGVIIYIYNKHKSEIEYGIRTSPKLERIPTSRSIISQLIKIAIPITVGASVIPLVNMVDLVIIPRRLVSIGYGVERATEMYGYLTGYANVFINFPQVVTLALAVSLVPAISESAALKDYGMVKHKSVTGIRLAILFGLPSAVGLSILAAPIIKLLYGSLTENEVSAVARVLSLVSYSLIFLTLNQTVTAILQGVGKVVLPVRNMFIGALAKSITNFVLVGIPVLNIRGAAIGTIVCYGVAASLNFATVKRHTRMEFKVMDFVVRPIVSVVAMAISVLYSYNWIIEKTGRNSISTIASIVIGIIVYLIMLLVIGALKQDDFDIIPGGRILAKILTKLGIYKNRKE